MSEVKPKMGDIKWVRCPICREPDMRAAFDGYADDSTGHGWIVTCTNLACPSNVGPCVSPTVTSPIPDQDQELKVNEDIKPKHVTSDKGGEDADLVSGLDASQIQGKAWDAIAAALRQGRMTERERCAELVESQADSNWNEHYRRIAAAIRNPTTQATSSASGHYENSPDHGRASEQNDSASPIEQGEGVARDIATDRLVRLNEQVISQGLEIESLLNERDGLREQLAEQKHERYHIGKFKACGHFTCVAAREALNEETKQ